jgi:hypothetical protein
MFFYETDASIGSICSGDLIRKREGSAVMEQKTSNAPKKKTGDQELRAKG